MSNIDDMELFVQVVKAKGLAAAGRQIGLSPATMTARINSIEAHYKTRLLQRTTRRISLTESGQQFYHACLKVLAEVKQAEALLQNKQDKLSGQLRITAPSDFGRQYVAPALAKFVSHHPEVSPYLDLSDNVQNLIQHGFDLGIRFGNLPDSSLVIRHLADNHRILVAAPEYLQKYGEPTTPHDLEKHRCLVLERFGELLSDWHFIHNNTQNNIKISPALSSNDGAILRQWAVAGKGIAHKSIWDVQADIKAGRLKTVLEKFEFGIEAGDTKKTGLQLVYPNRHYLPTQVSEFIRFLQSHLIQIKH